ncbi:MAG: hypothetical protein PUC59_09765 [Firmicutes bacterium]|nr:hypothetical protein [Bacillota bacterium]
MMDDSRDPRFVIEEEPEKTGVPDEKQEPAAAQEPSAEQKPSAEPETSAEPEPSVQPEQPEEENPLPADFYRPTSGQSEYSYLFSEQEEIDPYDYVMEKVRSKKKNRPFPEEQPEQPSPPPPKTAERKPAQPRPTVERDLSLEDSPEGEKKSLRESFGELLRWVTSGLRAHDGTAPAEHETEAPGPQKSENEAEPAAEDERQPAENAAEPQQDDEPATDLFAAAQQLQQEGNPAEDLPEEKPAAEQTVRQEEPDAAEEPPAEKAAAETISSEIPSGEASAEQAPAVEASAPEQLPEEAALAAEPSNREQAEEASSENAAEFRTQEENAPEAEEPGAETAPVHQVQVLPVAEPERCPRRAADDGRSERRALCVELDAERLFCGEELPEVCPESGEEGWRELEQEYAALTGKQAGKQNPSSAQRFHIPFLNRRRNGAGEPRPEAEKPNGAESVHQKEKQQPADRPDAGTGRRSRFFGRRSGERSGKTGGEEANDPAEGHAAPEDGAKELRKRLSKESRIVFFRLLAVGAIGIFLTIPAVCARMDVPIAAWLSPRQSPRLFSLINLIGIGHCLLLCRSVISVGLLSFFKGQKSAGADGAFSVAAIACALQALVAVIRPDAVAAGSVWLYAPAGALGLSGNLLGKLCMLRRTRENYADLCAMSEGFALARLEEEEQVQKVVDADVPARLTVGAVGAAPVRDFLRNSLEPDPGERSAERIFSFGFFGALAAALISFFASPAYGYDAALASYTAVCCLCAPFTATLAVNLPLRRVCRVFRGCGAVAVGWRAADLFGETGCVVLRDEDLFPADAVVLSGIKTLSGGRIDGAILDAAALLREAGGPMRTVFQRVIRGQTGILPHADQVTAEPGGFSGWVQGRRVFVGSGGLMAAHGITPPSADYEAKNCPEGTIPVYLARGGELCALFTVEYHADPELCAALQKLIRSGSDIAVLTTDSNLSAKMIAEKFSVPQGSVTMVPDVRELRAADVRQEDLEQPEIILRSPGVPALRAAAGCIEAKALFQLAVMLQTAGILLGLVLVFVFCAAGSIARIGTVEMLVFQLFWALAALVIPSLRRL